MGFLVDPSEQHEPPNTVSDEVPEQLLEVDSEGRTPLMAAVQTMQLLRPGPHKTVEVWVLTNSLTARPSTAFFTHWKYSNFSLTTSSYIVQTLNNQDCVSALLRTGRHWAVSAGNEATQVIKHPAAHQDTVFKVSGKTYLQFSRNFHMQCFVHHSLNGAQGRGGAARKLLVCIF